MDPYNPPTSISATILPFSVDSPAADSGESSNTRTWKDFVSLINGIWRKGAADYIACGQYLIEAKDELQNDAYSAMLKKLDFEASVAKKLICIAKNPTLGARVHQLPRCWSTLYELSKLDGNLLKAALADGSIHPRMKRKDAIALRAPAGAPPPANNVSPIARLDADWKACSIEERQAWLDQQGRAGLCEVMSSALLASLRDHVINLNIAGASKASPFAIHATDKLHVALRCAEQPEPSEEDIKYMIAALRCIAAKAAAKGITFSDIVIGEGKPKGGRRK